jgi:hypothetical protein
VPGSTAPYEGAGVPEYDRYRVDMALSSSSQRPVLETPPKPAERPCAFCEEAYWRFNGRSWWVCDRATGRRHACSKFVTLAQVQPVARGQADSRPLAPPRVRRQRRAGTVLALGLASVVAVLAGIWIYAGESK